MVDCLQCLEWFAGLMYHLGEEEAYLRSGKRDWSEPSRRYTVDRFEKMIEAGCIPESSDAKMILYDLKTAHTERAMRDIIDKVLKDIAMTCSGARSNM